MDSLISTFHIEWQIIIAQAINFVIVFIVIYYFALKPINKLMKERQNRIESGLISAKQNNELLDKTAKEYDSIITKARAEANEIFQNGKREAEANKKDMLAKAGVEVENMIENGRKSLIAEKEKMVDEAKKEIVSLVVKATEKVLASENNEDYEKRVFKNIKV